MKIENRGNTEKDKIKEELEDTIFHFFLWLLIFLICGLDITLMVSTLGSNVFFAINGIGLFLASFCFGRVWQKESKWFIGIGLAFLGFVFLFAAGQIIPIFIGSAALCIRGISIFRLHIPEKRKFKNFARGAYFIAGGLLTILNVSSLV